MAVDITYTTYNEFKQLDETNTEDAEFWLTSGLKQGGIEDQIKKLRELMAIIGGEFIKQYPDQLSKLAYAIDCKGCDFKVEAPCPTHYTITKVEA